MVATIRLGLPLSNNPRIRRVLLTEDGFQEADKWALARDDTRKAIGIFTKHSPPTVDVYDQDGRYLQIYERKDINLDHNDENI